MRIVVLGKELEYDFFDADLLEKYEKENLRVKERIQEPTQYDGKTTADSLRIQCGIVNDFFDEVFGNGTSEELFGGKNNIKEPHGGFCFCAGAAMSCNGELKALTVKYSPNRAESGRQSEKQNSKNFNRNAAYHGNKGKHH